MCWDARLLCGYHLTAEVLLLGPPGRGADGLPVEGPVAGGGDAEFDIALDTA